MNGWGLGKVMFTIRGVYCDLCMLGVWFSLNCVVYIRVFVVFRVVWKRKGDVFRRIRVIYDGFVLGFECGVLVVSFLCCIEGLGCDCL